MEVDGTLAPQAELLRGWPSTHAVVRGGADATELLRTQRSDAGPVSAGLFPRTQPHGRVLGTLEAAMDFRCTV